MNLEPQNPSLSMGTTKSLFHALPNFCLYCSYSYDYFCEKGSKISWGGAFWNSKIFFQASPSIGTTKSLCQAFLSSCLYSLYSYDYFCDMGAKVAQWGKGGCIFQPQNPYASPFTIYGNHKISMPSFPKLMFLQFNVPMIVFEKRGKNCIGGQGGAFFNPKILVSASPIYENH